MTARERLALDVTVFALVLLAANPAITGMGLHEWLGLSLVVPALLHLVLNWDWVVSTVTGFFGALRAKARVDLIVDAALFAALIAVSVSGVLVIPGLAASLGIDASGDWHAIHLVASNLTLAFTFLHFALHWQWVVRVTKRLFTPSRPSPASPAPTYATATAPARRPSL